MSLSAIRIVFYALAVVAVLLVTTIWQRAASKKTTPPPLNSQQRFNAVWTETIPAVPLKKADRIEVTTFPRVVVTERVLAPIPDAPVSAAPLVPNKPVARRKSTGDVCAQHGLVRVNHGKRWRCEKRKLK